MEFQLNKTASIPATSSSDTICIKCHKPALAEKEVERLPDGGTLIKAFHGDGKECSWAEYDAIEDMMEKEKKKNPRIIVCPACSKRGRINHYYKDVRKKENVSYLVVHEPIGGEWGKKSKVKRVRRCYINDPIQRDTILKKLGRYIEKR
jgi:hypothetical protein